MRWKIIIVNAGIVLVVGLLSYWLLATSLSGVVANRGERKIEVTRALHAANAQLALDALKLERWLSKRAQAESTKGVFASGTVEARQEAATKQANTIRDTAASNPSFARLTPSLVVFVDKQGIALGRNGSELMRGDNLGAAYPSLTSALKTGTTSSAVWASHQRQEQLFVSYAPVHGDDGEIVGSLVLGTPLNDERLQRTSELTSGRLLVLAIVGSTTFEVIANARAASSKIVAAAGEAPAEAAARSALKSGNPIVANEVRREHLFAATPLEGYQGEAPAALVAAMPTSLVDNLTSLLWPVLGVTVLGIVLVIAAGWLLGNYWAQPISEVEDGLLAIINGNSDLRFQLEHPELGGLVFRINSLLNALMGVPEDTTDDQGRPSQPATADHFQEALSVDESSVAEQKVDPQVAQALASEPADQYYRRLYDEYIQGKRKLGDPVDHITFDAFTTRIQGSEQEMAHKHGVSVRYQVQARNGAVVLVAVPLPGSS